jgi:hypothetical protein
VKTTELYLEQVFIGFLIIAIGALPWVPDLWDNLKNVQTVVGVAGGSAALGLAFWLGIPFDRLADTLFDRLDKRNRLDYALGLKRKPTDTLDKDDPYPENQYLISCRKQSATIIRQWDYHRSRIRLSRALAVYGPALTFVATFAAVHWKAGGADIDLSAAGCWFGIVIVAYAAWMILVLSGAKVPRTNDETKDHDAYKERGAHWLFEWQTWLVPVILIVAAIVYATKNPGHAEALLMAVGGAVLTAVSAWSWWRISTTYRDFLLDCWQFRDDKKSTDTDLAKRAGHQSPQPAQGELHGPAHQSSDSRDRDSDSSLHQPVDNS